MRASEPGEDEQLQTNARYSVPKLRMLQGSITSEGLIDIDEYEYLVYLMS